MVDMGRGCQEAVGFRGLGWLGDDGATKTMGAKPWYRRGQAKPWYRQGQARHVGQQVHQVMWA